MIEIVVIISLVVIILAVFCVNRIAKSILDIANITEKISKGNLNERVDVSNKKGEVARLAVAFNEMVERLNESFQSIAIGKKYAEDLIESANVMIIGMDLNGIIKVFNMEAGKLTGYKREELLGQNFFEAFASKELAPYIQEMFLKWVKSNSDFVRNSQYPLITKSGEKRFISWRNGVLKDSGNITGTISFGIDITDQIKSEEFQSRLHSILDSSPDFICLFDGEGNLFYLNSAGRKMAGIPEDEYVSPAILIFDCFPEHQKESFKNEWVPSAERDGIWSGEASILNRRGFEIPVSHVIIANREKDGTLKYFSLIARDITGTKQMLSVLEQSEKRFRELFEESKDMVYMSSPDGYFIDINNAGMEMLGYSSKEEVVKIDITKDLYSHPEDRKLFMNLLEKQGFVKDYETVFKKKNGDLINVLLTTTVVRDKRDKTVMFRGIIRDVTEKKKLEQQLLHAQKMEAIGQLAGGIAHDFNNILTAVIGYGAMLQDKIKDEKMKKSYVDPLLSAAEKAANLTQSLLAFSRKQPVDMKAVELNGIISGLEKLMSRFLSENMELTINLTEDKLNVIADKGQIEQVLINLVSNARDAMQSGGTLNVNTSTIRLDDKFIKIHGYGKCGKFALIEVSDSGVGIDEKTKEKIFDPFFTTKEVGKGTGLGLSIVYGIVKQHNGYINVYSEPGKGTTFRIYIPLMEREIEEKIEKKVLPPVGNDRLVLIAEDSAETRQITKTLLEEFGYRVIEAVDGEDALEKFIEKKDDIRIVIVDAVMPKKCGNDVYEEIRKIMPSANVIFTSGYPETIIDHGKLVDKKYVFLPKPISPENLINALKEVDKLGSFVKKLK